MKSILGLCTCRAAHLGKHIGSPLGRASFGEDWEIIPVRYCLNPEYIYQTIKILNSVKNKSLKSLAQDCMSSNYDDTIKYTESLQIDKYLIEISSLKYKDPKSSSGWSKYTRDDFFNKLNEIETLCGEKNIIYVSAANVNFTNEHIKDFGSYGKKFLATTA